MGGQADLGNGPREIPAELGRGWAVGSGSDGQSCFREMSCLQRHRQPRGQG